MLQAHKSWLEQMFEWILRGGRRRMKGICAAVAEREREREDWKNDSLWTDIGNWELEDTSDVNKLTYLEIW